MIKGSIALWRVCFPRARGANVGQWRVYGGNPNGRHTPVVDGDYVHFVGLRALNMTGCRQVTDAAFVHLRGIERLNMDWCDQVSITDAAFEHLRGIQRLDMSTCSQATIKTQPLITQGHSGVEHERLQPGHHHRRSL